MSRSVLRDFHSPKPTQSSSATLYLLPGYSNLSQSEERCKVTFGLSHLKYLTSHRLSYCESGSLFRLQYFRSKRIDQHLFTSDSFCIAQGVGLNNEHGHALSLQCRLRNFVEEARTGSEEVKDVQNVEDMHSYWFGIGAHGQLYEWELKENHLSECRKEAGKNSWILLARREGNVNIWHKLAELWQATVTIGIVRMAADLSSGLPYLTPEDNAKV